MACTPSAPTAAGVYWQDGKRWIAYDPQTAHQIQEALENVEKEVKIGPFNGWHFLIDLRTMTQRNVESGMETRVKVVAESNAELSPGRSSEELARRRAGGHCRLCPLLGAQRLMAQMMKRVRTRRTFSKMDGVQNSARPSSKLT
ncbi:hypothetical protein KFL_005260050 [Klebsormidium nitens]|uniref:WWE domain-containing protein n=1 Tax=Klebsormidium nitens TaxID=105231 RepID=A0A1Y1IEW5_KLENI|nr:hypothetical protein KFL_005260050 [Klebsormidium nitens]|eukprot:GAQ89465.1 hypothetical protein KFL_005260050 [Klebsormidium nitens]